MGGAGALFGGITPGIGQGLLRQDELNVKTAGGAARLEPVDCRKSINHPTQT